MQNIFSFLWRNHFFILFLLLEIFAIALIVRNNFYQKSVVFNSTNAIAGNILNTVSDVTGYFNLREINRQLLEENARLKSYHKSSFVFDDRDRFVMNDTVFEKKYTYLPAQVINNSIHRPNNYLTLNVGASHGVKPGMGVVSPMGVVGIVKDVSKNYSSVYSILHSESKITGKVGADEIVGTIIWPGKHYRKAEMKDIARHHEIKEKDTIFTSSFSQVFPPNIPIGKIFALNVNNAYDFYEIDVELATDFSKVSDVYVVISHVNDEQSELERRSQNE